MNVGRKGFVVIHVAIIEWMFEDHPCLALRDAFRLVPRETFVL
jgi:hypothetical protein